MEDTRSCVRKHFTLKLRARWQKLKVLTNLEWIEAIDPIHKYFPVIFKGTNWSKHEFSCFEEFGRWKKTEGIIESRQMNSPSQTKTK